MICLTRKAWGKLNLTLDVLGRRPDGYHALRSVMTPVSLSDTLQIRLGTGLPWQVRCDRAEVPQGEKNLCWKAARLYFDVIGEDPQGLDIFIEKQIPMQAGMAGGSADAAAVLSALNRHYGALKDADLRSIGLTVGSDVPFCQLGVTALAEGRGEILTPLPKLPEAMTYVLVQPDFSASTPALFARLDLVGVTRRPDNGAMTAAIIDGSIPRIAGLLSNAFQPVVEADFPVVGQICRELLENGALGACLTGTGSVVFGVFDGRAAADAAAAAMAVRYPRVFTARNVSGRCL